MIRALIVDDEKLVRKGMIAIMPWREHGIEVVEDVGSGEKALEFLKYNEIDLLITDLSMPRMTGLELVKKVKNLYPSISIVVLTFHQDFEFIQEALREGVIDYILKTQLEKEEMGTVLDRIVNRISSENLSNKQLNNNRPASTAELSQEDIHKLIKRWHSTEWLFDDYKYDELITEIYRLRPSMNVMETIYYSAINEWVKTLPFLFNKISLNKNNVNAEEKTDNKTSHEESSSSLEAWVLRLEGIRNTINGEINKPQYYKEIVASIMRSVEYINNNEGLLLKQEDVAKYVNMSRSYFSVCFKKVTGKSFYNYMRETKIKKAKNLLLKTQKPVYWIAEQLGYQDEKYFSRVFLEYTGVLPSEYRKSKMK